jgi:hypothetical protein
VNNWLYRSAVTFISGVDLGTLGLKLALYNLNRERETERLRRERKWGCNESPYILGGVKKLYFRF